MRILSVRVRIICWIGALFSLVIFCQWQSGAYYSGNNTYSVGYNAEGDSMQVQMPAGKMSRRDKAAQRRTFIRPIEAAAHDTSSLTLEAIRALPRDSSARIEQLKYVRRDKPAVDTSYSKTYPLFLDEPPIVKYQTQLDSARWVYRIRKTIGEYDMRVPIEIPLEEYTSLRLKQAIRQNWELLTQPSELLEGRKATLGELMGKITKIEVPIPKNPIFSIFGKNIIRMNINGSIDIKAGFRKVKYDVYSVDPTSQGQTAPDFKQEIQVGVKGEIGDKLKIDADWNTQRTFEYENQLHVRYQGYEDEIIQSIEAGNVSLPTKSSFFSGGQALFGIKAQLQMGPLRLTTVATQKKGQIRELTASGGGDTKPFQIRPTDYSQKHFFVDTTYKDLYEGLYLNSPPVYNDAKKIREIEVWVTSLKQIQEPGERNVVAFIDVDSVKLKQNDIQARSEVYQDDPGGNLETGRFMKLERYVHYDVDENAGIISIRTSLANNQAVAVSYISGINGQDTVGNSGQLMKDTLRLIMKLVRPSDPGPGKKAAWAHMLKNRYPLNVSGIEPGSFDFNIEFQKPGESATVEVLPQNIGVLEIFGLDQYSGQNNEQPVPDQKFDYRGGFTIDEKYGEIIFPTIEPFSAGSIRKFLAKRISDSDSLIKAADSLALQSLYDTTSYVAAKDPKNLFYMRGSVKGTSAKKQIGFNVVEGSVEVTCNGKRLVAGVDYVVDYISGEVEIRNQTYLMPGSDVQIKYEANDLFQLASKSLIGVRGDLDLGKSTSLGFTLMNYNQQSLSDKVRLGEEPISNTIMGFDAATSIDMPWLTNIMNKVPGIKTDAVSQLALKGEAAYVLPNPNTRSSPIPSDGGKGVAYIDDFEGAQQIIPLGVMYATWRDASAPWFIPEIDSQTAVNSDGYTIPFSSALVADGRIKSAFKKMEYKARANWFNIPNEVTIPKIWGEGRKSYIAGEDQVTALDFYYKPAERGAFNFSDSLDSTIGYGNPENDGSHKKAWAGIQRVMGTSSTDLIEQNISFIEFWINVRRAPADNTAKLNIDLGFISEDIIPDNRIESEDRIQTADPTGLLTDQKYDVGLDMLNDEQEQNQHGAFCARYPEFKSDPSGDNYIGPGDVYVEPGVKGSVYDYRSYQYYNGTQGNYTNATGRFPDSEDLNNNNNLDGLNSYFEYEIPLDSLNPAFQKLRTGIGQDHWYQIRIPLNDYTRKIGEPNFTSIEGVRVWLTGADAPVIFQMVDFNLVGNQWEKSDRTDTTYEVSVVNFEDDPNYRPPPGVSRLRDMTRSDKEIFGNEQSLNLIVKNLKDGEYKIAKKSYATHPLDMFNYRTLKMFVHGETGRDSSTKKYRAFSSTGDDAKMFIQFGDDDNNYYEYKAPVLPDWEGNDVVIKFGELTRIKAIGDTLEIPIEGGLAGSTYRVHGQPRLDRIKFITIGLENPRGVGADSISGELWVNELRLTDVDDTPGWAYRFDASLKLADFSNISFSYTERDPFFHGIEERFGSRNTSISWNLTGTLAIERFLPESWNGTIMSVNYSHSESITKPRYLPGQDILVEEAAKIVAGSKIDSTSEYQSAEDVRQKSESVTITDSYSIPTLKLNIPSKTWVITETINKMSFGYNYSQSQSRSPVTEYSKSWSWNANFKYATDFNIKNYLTLAGVKIFYTPKQISFSASLNRNQTQSKPRKKDAQFNMSHNLNAQRAMDFSWQFFEGRLLNFGMNYSVNISSSLYHLNLDKNNNLRPFYSILGDIFFSDRLVNFGIDQGYSQTIGFNTKVNTPKFLSLDKIITLGQPRYSVNYNWSNAIQAGPLGRTAGWSSGPGMSIDINIKPISDAIWPSSAAPASADTGKSGYNPLKQLDKLTRILIKYPFFEFEKFSVSFTQTNTSQNNGIIGSTGFANLFARVPFFQSSTIENGPSLLYQLGLISDPNGYLVLKTKGSFPFFTGYTVPGLRASLDTLAVSISNSFSQNNQLSLRTSRSLWEGVMLTLDWKVGWSYSENVSGITDKYGKVEIRSRSVNGTITRSFVSLPPVLMFKFFNTSIEKVNQKYEELKNADIGNRSTTSSAKLSQAFEEGMEAMPWLKKIFGAFTPRANWSIRWDGLEKYSPFNSFATSMSFDHTYNSSYGLGWHLDQSGRKVIDNQTISYSFYPLIGINVNFKEFLKGSLSGTFQYRASTTYNLSPSSGNATEAFTAEFSLSTSYSRKGFEIPLFGLSLSNNIDISFSYTRSRDSRLVYDFNNFNIDGVPQPGSTRTTIQPDISYSLSERVTVKLYYRYMKINPDAGGSISPGSTTNEGGVSVRVSIQ